jgi:putative flippase GtrA
METTLGQAPQVSNFSQKITGLLQKYPVVLQLCRFAAIGFLNTGLSFVLANLVSKYFGIEQGSGLGLSSGVGFLCATVQSYYWNKNWAFGQQNAPLLQNFFRLVIVGVVGVVTLGLVYFGSKFLAPYYYYIILLLVFIAVELVLWFAFKLSSATASQNPVLSFFVVSLIGFFINYLIASQFSVAVHLTANADLNKNLALVAATCISLIWNFIGYKIFVFKK